MNGPTSRLARILSDGFGESQRLGGDYLDFAGSRINQRMSPQRAAREAGVSPPKKTLKPIAAGKRENLLTLPPTVR